VSNTGRRVRSTEISVIGTNRQVSNMERSMNGAELKVLSTERSVISTRGAKCQSTEKSVDRRGEPSTEHGEIWKRSEPGIGTGCKPLRAEQSAIGEAHQVSSTEQSVSGAEFQVLNYGVIRSAE